MPDASSPAATKRQAPDSRWAVFVRAVRPFALWLMALGLALQVVVIPIVGIFRPGAVGLVNVDIVKVLVEGVLGLGAMRSIDKWLGNAT